MAKKPTAAQLAAVETLWNEFDPLGSTPAGVNDEYTAYVRKTHDLLSDGADKFKLQRYVENITYVSIGLSRSESLQTKIETFTTKLLALRP